MRTIVEQLHDAFEAKGWSVRVLLEKTGLKIDRTNLAKKLKGEIPIRSDEIEACATALEVTIKWPEVEKPANVEPTEEPRTEGAA